jgi:hypothetical protein
MWEELLVIAGCRVVFGEWMGCGICSSWYVQPFSPLPVKANQI